MKTEFNLKLFADEDKICCECTGHGRLDLRTPCKVCEGTGIDPEHLYELKKKFKVTFDLTSDETPRHLPAPSTWC